MSNIALVAEIIEVHVTSHSVDAGQVAVATTADVTQEIFLGDGPGAAVWAEVGPGERGLALAVGYFRTGLHAVGRRSCASSPRQPSPARSG